MRLKQLSLILAATGFSAATAFADTITWTGGAETYNWGDESNWDLNRVPGEADDVVIDGNITVSRGGQNLVISSLTLLNGATVENVGELKSEGNATSPVYTGGKVSCSLVALITGPVTISDAEIANSGTAHSAGFWHAGGYLNFVDGTACSAKYTFQTSLSSNPYSTFFSGTNPLIRYNDQVIDQATFDDNFQYVDNGDGTTTLSIKTVSGWRVSKPVAGEITPNEGDDAATNPNKVAISVDVMKKSGDSSAVATVVWGTSDKGDTLSSWSNAEKIYTSDELNASKTIELDKTFAAGFYYVRAFVTYTENDEQVTYASAPISIVVRSHDYGELDNVYEYIGTDDNLNKASNWEFTSGGVTTTPDAAPANDGTAIRWFGPGSSYTFTTRDTFYADTDHFVGTTIARGNGEETNIRGNLVLTDSTMLLNTISLNERVTITLDGSSLETTRADLRLGVWDPGYYTTQGSTFIDFKSGKRSTFTFTWTNWPETPSKECVKTYFVDLQNFTLDGAAIGAEDWETYFTVVVDGNKAEIIYDPVVHSDDIAGVSAGDITDNSATLTAQVTAMTSGARLYLAYGTSEPADADVLADADYTDAVLGVNSRSVTGLVKGATYHFRFALSVDGETILASRSGTFIPKQYDATCIDGVWTDGTAADLTGTDKRILVTGNLVRNGEIATPNKTFENGVVSAKTLINGSAPIIAHNVKFLIDRTDNLSAAPYSLYPPDPNKQFIDFRHDAPSNNTFFTAAAYTFNYNSSSAHNWNRPADADVFAYLFGGGRFLVDGSTVTSEAAQGIFTIVDNPNEPTKEMVDEEEVEVTSGKLTLTTTDDFPADAKGDWTVRDGAYIQLSANVSVDNLVIEGSNAVIDLNGRRLKAVSLTVNGTPVERGSYADASTASPVFKNGKLIVGADGFRVSIR